MPEVAVHTTVAVPTAAEAAAVKLTLCGVPGVTVMLEGDIVTPAGNPLTATLTVPEKPFRAVAVKVTGWALPPAVRLRLVTFAEKEKSGGLGLLFVVRENDTEWLSAPEVAVHITVVVPATAEAAAVKLTLCGVPGVIAMLEGDIVTPAGNPLTATLTVPEKPFREVTVKVTGCALPPAVRFRLVTLAENEKSGALLFRVMLLPQPQQEAASKRTQNHCSFAPPCRLRE